MIRFLGLFVAFALMASCTQDSETPVPTSSNPYDLVDPFIGTGGHGHTHPAATLPFGMIQAGPDTRLTGWDGCSGYHYSDDTIYGFSQTHLSGTGVSDYGDVLLMPVSGAINLSEDYAHATGFSHADEIAQPGRYEVTLDNGIKVRIAAGLRSAIYEFAFPDSSDRRLLIDLDHRDQLLETDLYQTPQGVAGYRISNAWADSQQVYFDLSPSEAIRDFRREANKAELNFGAGQSTVLIRIGISPTGGDGANVNRDSDRKDFDIEAMLADAEVVWSEALRKVVVSGGSRSEQVAFYTSMYHSLVAPNLYNDANGFYLGMDRRVHRDTMRDHYTVFSFWDTYRATHPLYTLIERDRTNDFIKTLLADYEEGGTLPIWKLADHYTGCMIGYHAIPVIADAYVKRIGDYDVDLAMEAMMHSADLDWRGLESYKEFGYIPGDREAESVSRTLEYAYDDWCIAKMLNAAMVGGHESTARDRDRFLNRGESWKHLFDPATGFFRARMNGAFVEPFDPAEVNFHFTEANAWQYSLYVPQDIPGLMDLMGGQEALADHLDRLFTVSSETSGRDQADITGLIGQYAHGNEPSHHMAYLYNWVGQPWKTQMRVRQIMEEMYSDQPDGLSGNEDCGQMSSWYVFSASGFYPVTPGEPVYSIGSPIFDTIHWTFEDGEQFTVVALNNGPENIYIQSATLNGKPYDATYIDHHSIVTGGELVLEMGPTPAEEWGVSDRIPNKDFQELAEVTPAPFISPPRRVFDDSVVVEIGCADSDAVIEFKTSGDSWQKYSGPLTYRDDVDLEFRANGGPVQKASYIHRTQRWTIVLENEYAAQYAAGGDGALIDMLNGPTDFRTGFWQGYEGHDLVATVDLGKYQNLHRLGLGTLQDENSWIFFPTEVQFEVSDDGENFRNVGSVQNKVDWSRKGSLLQTFSSDVAVSARYVRVRAVNRGVCPPEHKGAGGKCWVFADEIIIE